MIVNFHTLTHTGSEKNYQNQIKNQNISQSMFKTIKIWNLHFIIQFTMPASTLVLSLYFCASEIFSLKKMLLD